MDIAISKRLTAPEIEQGLRTILPTLVVAPSVETWVALSPKPAVSIWLIEEQPLFAQGFCTALSVNVRLAESVDVQLWLVELARCMSIQFECKACCDGTSFGPTGSPYFTIIWDRGVPYLADDSETDANDHQVGALIVMHRLTELEQKDYGPLMAAVR